MSSSPLHNQTDTSGTGRSGSISSLKSLTVQILQNHRPSASFDVALADLRQREDEMKQTAQQFKIPISRWKASRLYQAAKRSNNGIVQFDPEKDIILQNYSFSMEWRPWLTVLFGEFFRTGQLRVPDECRGSDLLLALEYFGILYAPNQLVFASYSVYQRVRAWSDYLSHRTALGDWVAGRIQKKQASIADRKNLAHEVLFFATIQNSEEETAAGDLRIPGLGCEGGESESASYALVHRLFNTSNDNHVAQNLREDFCVYLQNLFVDEIKATFAIKMVEVSSTRTTNRSLRAILKIEFVAGPEEDAERSSWHEQNERSVQLTPRSRKKMEEGASTATGDRKVLWCKSESSPVDVTKDIYDGPKSTPKKDPLTILLPSSPKQHLLRAPDVDERDDFYRANGKQKTYTSRPPEMDLRTPMLGTNRARAVDPLLTSTSVSGWNAPFDIVDPERLDSQTVASALTGPFFPSDDSFTMDTAMIRAEAMRHEWVQGNLLTRDISKQMRELLDVPEVDETQEDEDLIEAAARRLIQPQHALHFNTTSCQPWDWINTVCQGAAATWDDNSVGYEVPSPDILSPTHSREQDPPKLLATDEKSNKESTMTTSILKSRTQPSGLVSPTALSIQKSRTQSLSIKLEKPMESSPLLAEATQQCRMLVKERLKKIEKYDWKVEPKRREMPTLQDDEEVKVYENEDEIPLKTDVVFETTTLKVAKESSRVCLGALFCRRKVPEGADNE
ncbi:hypothetical protein ACA910_016693 [Epithemia clementina (nom. ined.)]